MDQTAAAEWLADADQRLKALALLKQSSGQVPVTLSSMRSNAGWTIGLQFREIPREIFYRLDGEGEFRSTGHMDAVNSATGLKMPNMSLSLRPSAGKTGSRSNTPMSAARCAVRLRWSSILVWSWSQGRRRYSI